MIVAGAAHDVAAWLAFFAGLILGGFAVLAFLVVSLLIVATSAPRRSLHRQTARDLNQALADYFGTRDFDESDALLVRLRAATSAHYDALRDLDHLDGAEERDRVAGEAAHRAAAEAAA